LKTKTYKSKILWGISMSGLLGLSYWISRYFFFELHGMVQWPDLLAIVSLVIIVIASFFGDRIVPLATITGYLGGFILAMIFNTDGVDPGGGGTNNAWIIWGTFFGLSILTGFIFGVYLGRSNANAKQK